MTRDFDAAGARILGPLSALLKKQLRVVDGADAERTDAFTIHLPLDRLSIVAAGGGPFSEAERQIVYELFDLIRHAEEGRVRAGELQERVSRLERENLELIVRNRLLSEASSRDALTGLYNRWYVMDKIEAEINRSLRHGAPLSLLMLDIDHFKRVNDTFGHLGGDDVLKSFAKLVRNCLRKEDLLARYGGEEFVVLLPGASQTAAFSLAQRIREEVSARPFAANGQLVRVTVSVGLACEGGDTLPSLEAMLGRADEALYKAKHEGRNQVIALPMALNMNAFAAPAS
ncbi:MAG TPA: GGDEF domain-containing protein [Thermoanaerobaculia bacterium]